MKVLSVDHRSGDMGRYFNFIRVSIPGLEVDGTLWLKAKNKRTGFLSEIQVWGKPNGGSVGDAHGRWSVYEQSAPGQWKTGDTIIVFVTGGRRSRIYWECMGQRKIIFAF